MSRFTKTAAVEQLQAQAAAYKKGTDFERQYDELFQEAVKAAAQAGWGIPKTHDDLIAALQTMAIPTTNY